MIDPQPPDRVLIARLTERATPRGMCLTGYAGATCLVVTRGPPDEAGRPTWDLVAVERRPSPGAPPRRESPEARMSDRRGG